MDNSITFIDYMLRDSSIENIQFPLGLLCLAANIKDRDCYIAKFDNVEYFSEDIHFKNAVDKILSYGSKYFGFSTICSTYHITLRLAEELKKIKNDAIIIFGGPQATATSTSSMQNFNYIDFIVLNEADHSLPVLLKHLDSNESFNSVNGVIYRGSNDTLIKNDPVFIEDLNTLPIPSTESIQNPEEHNFYKTEILIDIGRGCPFSCTYCSTCLFFNKRYRMKTIERIIREINFYIDKYKIRAINTTHDMLTYNKDFIIELCSEFCKIENLQWTCSVRLDCVDEDIIKALSNSGCKAVFIGVESGSSRIQKLIKKNLNLSSLTETLMLFYKYKIEATCAFMSAFPFELKEDISQTFKAILDSLYCLADAQNSLLSPVPGTKLFEEYQNELKFDNTYGSFSNSLLTSYEINKYIKKYPDIFSTFYYIENENIDREFYKFSNHLISQLGSYKYTISMLVRILEKK